MTSRLPILIRLARMAVDEARRDITEVTTAIARTEAAIEALDVESACEIRDPPEGLPLDLLGRYLTASRDRRAQRRHELSALEQTLAEHRLTLASRRTEEKRLERVQDHQEARERVARERREQRDLEELALIRRQVGD